MYHCTLCHCCVLFYSFPLSTADTRRFSVEENEAPLFGKIHSCYHRHGYEKQEALCLTRAKPSESRDPMGAIFAKCKIIKRLYRFSYILKTEKILSIFEIYNYVVIIFVLILGE